MRRLETTGMDDQDHLAVIGAALKAVSAQGKLPLGRLQELPDWAGNAHMQGVSTPNEELDYLPLDGIDYTNTSGSSADLEDEMVALPQRPFRGERIVLSCLSITAGGVVDALFRLIITPAIYVGAVQIGATQGRMPGAAFAATSFGVRLSMPVAGQGTRIYIPVIVPAVADDERIMVGGGIFGRAVR